MKHLFTLLCALAVTLGVNAADNLAKGKTAIATSEAQKASLAVDGNSGTRWESVQADEASKVKFQVDLGAAQDINQVRIIWEGAYAKSFTIVAGNTVGDDGYLTDGETVCTVSGETLAGFPLTKIYNFTKTVNARYVEFVPTEKGSPYGISFWEFEVYNVTDTQAPELTAPTVSATTSTSATLTLKATDNTSANVTYVITANGKTWTTTGASGAEVSYVVNNLEPSTTYNFSVVAEDEDANQSAAQTVSATTTAMTIPAVPAVPTDIQVTNIYTVDGNAAGYFFIDWGGSNGSGKEISINGKKAYMISTFTYYGSQFTKIDASTMKTLHLDVYAPEAMDLTVVPICRNAEDNANTPEKGVQFTLKAGEWNALEVPVADLVARGANFGGLYQMKYVGTLANKVDNTAASDGFGNGDGSKTFIIGNVYLSNADAKASLNISAAKNDRGMIVVTGTVTKDNVAELNAIQAEAIDLSDAKIADDVTASDITLKHNVVIAVKGTVTDGVAATTNLPAALTGRKNLIVRRSDSYLFPVEQLDFVDDPTNPIFYDFFFSTGSTGYKYTRTIAAGSYATVAMPATVPAADIPAGLSFYKLTAYDTEKGEATMTKLANDPLNQNAAFIVHNTTDAAIELTCSGMGDLNLMTNDDAGTTFNGVTMLATKHPASGTDIEGCYIFQDNKLKKVAAGSTVVIPGQRAYFKVANAAAKESISLVFNDGETTGISTVKPATAEKADVYYDLQGRRVVNPTRGLYIHNGKKVIK